MQSRCQYIYSKGEEMTVNICDFCEKPKIFPPTRIKVKKDDNSLGLFFWNWEQYDICEICYNKMLRYIKENAATASNDTLV